MSGKKESKKARDLRYKLRQLNADIATLQGEEREVKQALANELAEYAIGALVFNDLVPSVVVTIKYYYGGVRYHIRRVKKSGELFAIENEVWDNSKLKARSKPQKYEEIFAEFLTRMKKEDREERDSEQG